MPQQLGRRKKSSYFFFAFIFPAAEAKGYFFAANSLPSSWEKRLSSRFFAQKELNLGEEKERLWSHEKKEPLFLPNPLLAVKAERRGRRQPKVPKKVC